MKLCGPCCSLFQGLWIIHIDCHSVTWKTSSHCFLIRELSFLDERRALTQKAIWWQWYCLGFPTYNSVSVVVLCHCRVYWSWLPNLSKDCPSLLVQENKLGQLSYPSKWKKTASCMDCNWKERSINILPFLRCVPCLPAELCLLSSGGNLLC